MMKAPHTDVPIFMRLARPDQIDEYIAFLKRVQSGLIVVVSPSVSCV